MEKKYFHCYATANESSFYIKDIHNLMRIKNNHSGFDRVILFIAISEVKEISFYDHFFVSTVKRIFNGHPTIELRDIYFKSNIGRDFSSFKSLFQKVNKTATDVDLVLFQNRSGYGPFNSNWYKQFVSQFEKFDTVAICGSTINFNDHPERSHRNDLPHVQTYSFLTRVRYFNMFGTSFPAEDKTEKLEIITEGEIALSQFFLDKGYAISCIEWPNDAIFSNTKPISATDVKAKVREKQFFYHRLYFRKNILRKITLLIPNTMLWMQFMIHGLKK